MQTRTILKSLATFLIVANSCVAQLTVEVKSASVITTTESTIVQQLTTEDGTPIGMPTESEGPTVTDSGSPAAVLQIATERPIDEMLVKLKSKTCKATRISAGLYVVTEPGTHEIDVNVIGQSPLTWDDETVTVVVGDPAPPEPLPDGASVSERIRWAVQFVRSPTRSSEAAAMAAVFRSVAGRAAGLSQMTAQGMIESTATKLREVMDEQARVRWSPWQEQYVEIYNSLNLGSDKQRHIQVWGEIADGLAVRQ